MTAATGPRVFALVGATASGKTDLAVEAALRCERKVEILALDSRQLYRDLDVGTGKPDAAQRAAVAHHLLDLLGPDDRPDAMWFREQAQARLREVLDRGCVPLFVGGSGFYLRALREGFFDIEADDRARDEVRARVAALDEAALDAELGRVDPLAAARLHPNDRYRRGRALEIAWLTGRPMSRLEEGFEPRPVLGARFAVFRLTTPRATLHERIARRTAAWLDHGWRDEVEALLARGADPRCPALRTLGYREVVDWILGQRDRETSLAEIVVRTRRYARQQETWFRKETGACSIEATDVETLVAALGSA